MQSARRSWFANPTTWYIGASLLLLVVSVWFPVWTAQRTARVEGRADQIAGLLLEASSGFPTTITAAEVPIVLARFYALAGRDHVHLADLEGLDPPLPDTLISLRNKHYLFHFAESAPDARAIASPDSAPAYEAMAWPIESAGPGHSTFFHPDNAPRAFTRNLSMGYIGLGEDRPRPSRSHRRLGAMFEISRSYRNLDDERWMAY